MDGRTCVCLSTCLLAFRSVCLSVCLFVRLFVCLPISLSFCRSVCLGTCLTVCLFVCLPTSRYVLSVCLSVWTRKMLGNLSTSQMTGVPVHLAPINKTERKIPRWPLKKHAGFHLLRWSCLLSRGFWIEGSLLPLILKYECKEFDLKQFYLNSILFEGIDTTSSIAQVSLVKWPFTEISTWS
jgi:hypothetical protein